MNLITERFDRRAITLKYLLRYWFALGHLQPEQGIALLSCFMLDDEDEKSVVDWGNSDNDGVSIVCMGFPLLKQDKICSWLALDSGDVCAQLDRINCTKTDEHIFSLEHLNTIFAVSVLQHRQMLQLWKSDNYKHSKLNAHPLAYFVEWGRSRAHIPEWMPTAVDLKLIQGDPWDGGDKQTDAMAQGKTSDLPTIEVHQYKSTRQEKAILNWLKNHEYDPQQLPLPRVNGLPGIKKTCRDEMCIISKQLFYSKDVFDTAWQRLRDNDEIIDASKEK